MRREFLALCVALSLASTAGAQTPRAPVALRLEERGTLLVLCEKSGTILRVDPRSGDVQAEVAVGEYPYDAVFHPDGERLFVTCRRSQEMITLDAATLEIRERLSLVGEPAGIEVSADGRRLFISLHSLDQVAVLDLETGEQKRLMAGNGPLAVERRPSHGGIYVANLLSNPVRPGEPCRNEITVVDETTAAIRERIILHNANIGRHIDFTPDGTRGVLALSRPKNLVPGVQVARGWIVTNGFALLRESGQPPRQLLIDLPNRAFADVYGAAWLPDGSKFYLTASGVDRVIAVDVTAVEEVERRIEREAILRPEDHLGLSRDYVVARPRVGAHPVDIEVSRDGRHAYVANRLSDSISVIDTTTDEVVRTIRLGTAVASDPVREGERIFHAAEKVFQNQFACASCHPEGGVDGLQYDLEPDGIGQNILDNRDLRAVDGTAPFKWVGSNPDIATQCGTRTAKWIVRTGWLSSAEVVSLATYIHSIPAMPNAYRSETGRLTRAQRRGKRFFERTHTNGGELIPEENRCTFCHPAPKFTNQETFDVGTASVTDTKTEFDSAHLVNIYDSPPYLHDGRAATLEEIWTVHNPEDKHGFSSDWTKQQLNDLVEYLRVLGPGVEP